MALDRSGPYEIFQRHLESVAADVAAEAHTGMGLHSLVFPGAGIVATIVDVVMVQSARDDIFKWIDNNLLPNPKYAAGALLDVAGVSLVCAIHHADAMVDLGPQRKLRHLMAAAKGFTGGHDGKWAWGGFESAFNGYGREQVASKSLHMYRNFVFASLSRLHIKHHFDTRTIESATRQYALSSLKDVGKIHVGTAAALRTDKDFADVCLADVVADQKWYKHLKFNAYRRPLPDWLLGGQGLFAGDKYGPLVGLV